MAENYMDKVVGEDKPKKEIDHIRVRKAKSGGHVVEHHHTAPGHHKMEEHVMPHMNALQAHMQANMGPDAPMGGDGGAAAMAAPAPEGAAPAAAQPAAPTA